MYEAFFGLDDLPFRLTPDPSYLYLSPKHAEALAHLRLGLTESSGFVCITGEVGAGKTTLLRTFLAELGSDVLAAYIFNPSLSALELLRRINRELGLPAESESRMELVDALNDHLLAERRRGRLCVVVVDEAQALSGELLEQLRLLSNLETSKEKLLRLVLVGQPQLRDVLLDPAYSQLNQRITLRWHIGSLNLDETIAYVRHRLDVASGGKAEHLFTRPALRALHRGARGVPRLVNMLGHRALLAAFVARRRRVTASVVRQAYREIGTVPLHRPAKRRRSAWVAAAAAGVLAAVGVGAASGRSGLEALRSVLVSGGPEAAVPGAVPAPAAPAPEGADVAGAGSEAPIGRADLADRLAALAPARTAHAATDAVLAVWGAPGLAVDEVGLPRSLEQVAWRRRLEDLHLTGNLSMLRVLDLPALLELRVPGVPDSRWAALVGIDDDHVVLHVDSTRIPVPASALAGLWFGEAHVLWRDFDGLGPTLGRNARGPRVEKLQRLLQRVGLHDGPTTGVFDDATTDAVLAFQRSRLLDADARVGRLTRIVLYGAVGEYQQPTLSDAARGRS